MTADPRIRPVTREDAAWVIAFLRDRWGSERVAAHDVLYAPAELPGFIAELDGSPAGLVTYTLEGDGCEIVTLDSVRPALGVGTALVDAVADAARAAGRTRLWLISTNDNLHAQTWYGRRGFTLAAVRDGAVDRSRRLKPEIPVTGAGGIPIRDELEFERDLTDPGP